MKQISNFKINGWGALAIAAAVIGFTGQARINAAKDAQAAVDASPHAIAPTIDQVQADRKNSRSARVLHWEGYDEVLNRGTWYFMKNKDKNGRPFQTVCANDETNAKNAVCFGTSGVVSVSSDKKFDYDPYDMTSPIEFLFVQADGKKVSFKTNGALREDGKGLLLKNSAARRVENELKTSKETFVLAQGESEYPITLHFYDMEHGE